MSNAEMSSVVDNSGLRVAILSDSDRQRENLKHILEEGGMCVIENELLSADSIKALDPAEADVLLVDMDDNAEHELDFLDELMDSTIPILFNDASATRMRAAQKNSDWGRNLARKLASIANEKNDADSPVRKKDAGETDQAANIADEPVDYLIEADYLEELGQQAIKKAEAEIIQEQQEEQGKSSTLSTQPVLHSTAGVAARNVWVIGASIGGPQSVKRFLAAIQHKQPVAFVLAQHIGSNFVSLLAKQLDKVTGMRVMAAEEGHLLKHNEVVIAPTAERVTLDKRGFIRLKQVEYSSIYTPSIDTVMTDISMRYGIHTSALMFSGMGSDGVRGTQLIAARGGKIWAQDSESCVISSMPDSSRRAGVVGYTGTPEELAEKLIDYFKTNTR